MATVLKMSVYLGGKHTWLPQRILQLTMNGISTSSFCSVPQIYDPLFESVKSLHMGERAHERSNEQTSEYFVIIIGWMDG